MKNKLIQQMGGSKIPLQLLCKLHGLQFISWLLLSEMFCIPGGRKSGQLQVHDLVGSSGYAFAAQKDTCRVDCSSFTNVCVRRSGRNNLFYHRNQKVFLSFFNMYCKLHALVEPGLSPLGKSFEWQHSKKKNNKKNF